MIELREHTNGDKALFIDGVCQGVVDKDGTPLSPYMKPIMERIAGLQANSELMFLGGGLCALPKWAKDRGHRVSVTEMDDEVIKLSGAVEAGLSVFNKEALDIVSFEEDWFDFILLDVWPNDPNMYCADFFVVCKRYLKKGGLFAMNYLSDSQVEIDAMGKLLAAVFPNVKMTVLHRDKEMKEPCQVVYFGN